MAKKPKKVRRPLWDYLFFDKKLPRKPEVTKIAGATGQSRLWVVGALMEFWSWVDDHYPGGFLSRFSVHDLSRTFPELSPEFFHSMSEVGWLIQTDSGLEIPNADRWFGETSKKRFQDRLRKWHDQHNLTEFPVSKRKTNGRKLDENRTLDTQDSDSDSGSDSDPSFTPQPPHGGPAPVEFLEAWNAAGLTRAQKLTTKRLKHLRARSADPDWVANWRAALERAKVLPFCRGQNDRGWLADIDWFLRPDTVTKLLEGRYVSAPAAGTKPPASSKSTDDIAREQADRRKRSEEDRARAVPLAKLAEEGRARLAGSPATPPNEAVGGS